MKLEQETFLIEFGLKFLIICRWSAKMRWLLICFVMLVDSSISCQSLSIWKVSQIKSLSHSPHLADARIKWLGPSPRLNALAASKASGSEEHDIAPKKGHNVGDTASNLTGPAIDPWTSHTDSDGYYNRAEWLVIYIFCALVTRQLLTIAFP